MHSVSVNSCFDDGARLDGRMLLPHAEGAEADEEGAPVVASHTTGKYSERTSRQTSFEVHDMACAMGESHAKPEKQNQS